MRFSSSQVLQNSPSAPSAWKNTFRRCTSLSDFSRKSTEKYKAFIMFETTTIFSIGKLKIDDPRLYPSLFEQIYCSCTNSRSLLSQLPLYSFVDAAPDPSHILPVRAPSLPGVIHILPRLSDTRRCNFSLSFYPVERKPYSTFFETREIKTNRLCCSRMKRRRFVSSYLTLVRFFTLTG